MASVNVTNIAVFDNPCIFTTGFRFEVTFECVAPLSEDLEWKVIYVGSASGPQYDQELENVAVGPVPVGTSKFVLATPPPDPSKIPEDDLLGATVALICCSYKGHEFIRVGYWINNTYGEPVPEGAEVPKPIDPSKEMEACCARILLLRHHDAPDPRFL